MGYLFGGSGGSSGPSATLPGAVYDLTRINPNPSVAPTNGEIGGTLKDQDTVFVHLSNGNVERWGVNAALTPVLRDTIVGERRFQTLPTASSFRPATDPTTKNGDLIELVAGDNPGWYECVNINGPGTQTWMMRSTPKPMHQEQFTLTAADITTGFVTIQNAPKAISGVTNTSTSTYHSSASYTYTPATRRVTIPAGTVAGNVLVVSYQMP